MMTELTARLIDGDRLIRENTHLDPLGLNLEEHYALVETLNRSLAPDPAENEVPGEVIEIDFKKGD